MISHLKHLHLKMDEVELRYTLWLCMKKANRMNFCEHHEWGRNVPWEFSYNRYTHTKEKLIEVIKSKKL